MGSYTRWPHTTDLLHADFHVLVYTPVLACASGGVRPRAGGGARSGPGVLGVWAGVYGRRPMLRGRRTQCTTAGSEAMMMIIIIIFLSLEMDLAPSRLVYLEGEGALLRGTPLPTLRLAHIIRLE